MKISNRSVKCAFIEDNIHTRVVTGSINNEGKSIAINSRRSKDIFLINDIVIECCIAVICYNVRTKFIFGPNLRLFHKLSHYAHGG